MDISLTQIQYLLAVDQFRHFGQASRHCHVSQPSLSTQIQKAEEALGFLVFDRSTKPISVTQKGEIALSYARNVMHDYHDFLSVKDAKDIPSGSFSLGIIPTIAPYILPTFIPLFAAQYPKVFLSITTQKTDHLVDALVSRELDGAILATAPHVAKLQSSILFRDAFFMYTSDPQLLKQKTISTSLLRNIPMWLLDDGHCFRDQVIDVCKLDQRTPVLNTIRFSGGSLEAILYMIRNGIGTTILPGMALPFLSDTEKTQHIRPLQSPAPYREIRFVTRSNAIKSAINLAIMTTLQSDQKPPLSFQN